ncbi:MAG: hydroxymethylbilane synthase [Candidatus Latescibacteria bacterium]|nr:hydroxymethylbilane synthase [Candidatus Latescibacterota bacterium]
MSLSLIIGTRGSQLALAQTRMVAHDLQAANPGLTVETRTLTTTGDRITDAPLASFGGEGVFVKELERALLSGEIDLAVHSLKDLPTTVPDGLVIAAVPERADVRDALLAKQPGGLAVLPDGARIGTSSPRRRAQLLSHRPDLQITNLRGNLDTRLRKLTETDLDAIVLAAAGLDRLGWSDRITERLSCEICLPAVSQGALAVETRRDDDAIIAAVSRLNHEPTVTAVTAERAFLRALGGGCQVPVGAWARFEGPTLRLDGMIAHSDGVWLVRDAVAGRPDEAEELGSRLAAMLLERMPKE